jgi:hypothetical protein
VPQGVLVKGGRAPVLPASRLYSASISRADLGFSPVSIDASGYDAAIVDTPQFIKVRGIARRAGS